MTPDVHTALGKPSPHWQQLSPVTVTCKGSLRCRYGVMGTIAHAAPHPRTDGAS